MVGDLDADGVIRLLGLDAHPEGGCFRETFRDPATDAQGRSAGTAIYYLLRAGEVSHWHRVDAAEIWHYHAGAPLELALSADGEAVAVHRLGGDLLAGERPQLVVPKGAWQSARCLADAGTGGWTLVGCTVSPGFDFAGFEMAPPGWRPSSR
jgi:predicted cupin superfamily sugar epimerase